MFKPKNHLLQQTILSIEEKVEETKKNIEMFGNNNQLSIENVFDEEPLDQ